MNDGVPVPAQWRSFRRGQAAGALVFVPFAALGLWGIVDGDVGLGLAVFAGFGVFAGLAVLNARTGRRGVGAVRTEVRHGRTELVFPAHRLGTLLTLLVVVALVAGPLVWAGFLAVRASPGSSGAGAGAVVVVVLTGGAVWLASRLPGGHRNWPSVRLGAAGVEITGVFKGSFLAWEQEPVPVAWANGVLRLIPSVTLNHLADSAPARFKDLWSARPGWIPPTVIDADLGAVAAAVLFYGLVPERRVELESPAAVERVRNGGLPSPWPPTS